MTRAKKIAMISYLTIIGTLVALLMHKDEKHPFAAFHIRQSLGIFLTFYLLGYFVGYFDSWNVTVAFWIFIAVLWAYGFAGALQGKMLTIPLLGGLFQKFFKSI